MLETRDASFSQLLLSLKHLEKGVLLSVQAETQDLLQLVPVDAANAPLTIDMGYFSVLMRADAQVETIPMEALVHKVRQMDREHLLLLDVMITFLLNGKDFKKALPQILERLQGTRAQIHNSKITEFGFLTLSFPYPPQSEEH